MPCVSWLLLWLGIPQSLAVSPRLAKCVNSVWNSVIVMLFRSEWIPCSCYWAIKYFFCYFVFNYYVKFPCQVVCLCLFVRYFSDFTVFFSRYMVLCSVVEVIRMMIKIYKGVFIKFIWGNCLRFVMIWGYHSVYNIDNVRIIWMIESSVVYS